MNNDNWNEEKIEQLLSNAPKIIDHRSKEEVFQRLKEEGVFDDKPMKKEKVVKSRNWLPYVISVAAILICIISIPSILNGVKTTQEKASSDSNNLANYDKSELANEKHEKTSLESPTPTKTAVYAEDLEENTIFTIGLVSEAADSVPITILISKDQIEQDLGVSNPTMLRLYSHYAPLLDEEALGFIDYHPYVGKLTESGNKLVHILPTNQTYDTASASFTTYEASLIDTFSKDYDAIEFQNEDGTPFYFNEIGEMDKPLQLNGTNTQYNYFRFTQSNGSQYLVPNFRASYNSVEEAINEMEVETNDIYESVILGGVDYSIRVEGDIVFVKFNSEVNLNDFDQTQAMQMIEGVLLTAASFNKQVQFENIANHNWEDFDFTKPLPMPIGPNKIVLAEVQ